MQLALFMFVGVLVGSLVALQNVVNASLGRFAGSLGAVFVVAITGAVLILGVILLLPRTADLRHLPGPNQWYLYLGGLLGLVIVATPVFLVPRIGATATVTAIVIGQLIMAVVADQFGLFGNPKIELTIPRLIGVLMLASGAYLVARS
jgi:transporter family-2 protein